jgi:antitoxin MazE
MVTRVQKWGNSLALRLPKAFMAETNIEQDTLVDITLEDGKLIVDPVQRRRWTLEELLEGITEDNRHGETDTGEARGKEVWCK